MMNIALVAHDEMKNTMIGFCIAYENILKKLCILPKKCVGARKNSASVPKNGALNIFYEKTYKILSKLALFCLTFALKYDILIFVVIARIYTNCFLA